LCEELKSKGYNVNLTTQPMSGGNGEFFIYVVKDGKNSIVFSNNQGLHGKDGAIIDRTISKKNMDSIISVIQKTIS
jgi:hypothetical protein